MWPDDERLVALNDDGLDPESATLAGRLAAAGERTRGAESGPSRAFATGLRARLVGDAPMAVAAGPASVRPQAPTPLGAVAPTVVGDAAGLDGVRPRVVRRAPTVIRIPRWSLAAVAAAVVIAVLGIDGRWLQGGPADASVVGATDATLIRDGARTALRVGAELTDGDRIVTGPDGSATLAIAGGETRLLAAADLTIVDLGMDRVALDQAAGRVWHRVAEPVERYAVATADVTWTATGTAFDLDRHTTADGPGETVRAIGIEHDVTATGPGLAVDVREGTIADIALDVGPAARDVRLTDVTAEDLRDPWLRWNGTRDLALGFDTGILDPGLAEATRTPTMPPAGSPWPTATATGEPAQSEAPTATATTGSGTTEPTASPRPTPRPTASPTPKPTPTPTPTPTPGLASLGLTVTTCHGGVAVLDWTEAAADAFGHYQGLRSTAASIAPVYPPQAPAVAPDGLYSADRSTLRGVDAGLEAGATYAYRAVALTADDQAFAASAVKQVTAKAVKELGALDWALVEGSVVTEWLAYGGPEACFSLTKLVLSQDDETPSSLEGATAVWAAEDQALATATLEGLGSGTYFARVEVLRETWAGKAVIARTGVAEIVVP